MNLKIKTLTPLWTGDVDGKCNKIKETGIIGSLRWWYEAIVRGLGGYACDPTSDNRCELSGKEKTHEERLENLCPSCFLFGCGGWKRGFRLEITTIGQSTPFQLATLDKKGKFNHRWLSKIFEKSIGTDLPFGEVSLDFKWLRSDEEIEQLKALLSVMNYIGAIGAKTQYGFGQFEWGDKMELKEATDIIQRFLESNTFKKGVNNEEWYSLDKFWRYEVKLSTQNKLTEKFKKANIVGDAILPQDYLPVSFDIRYKLPTYSDNGLRQSYYKKHRDKHKTRKIFGTLKNDKIGSRIFVSHLFKKKESDSDYWLRVWGFTDQTTGEEIGEELKKMFSLEERPPIISGEDITKGGSYDF